MPPRSQSSHLQQPEPHLQPLLFYPPRRPAPSPWTSSQRLWSGLSCLSSLSKRSYRSFATSSFEADDEHSSGSASSDRDFMSSRGSFDLDRPAGMAATSNYHDQDARPTSAKEILGWYSYAFAAEVYTICGISSFIPILLETLARQNGVLLSDRSKACGSSDDVEGGGSSQCIVTILGLDIDTGSFTMYTFSISVFVQALLVVSISGAADHGNYRKKLLLGFAWLGSLSVMAFIFVGRTKYVLGALLTIISNMSFGASFVLLNSFLPLLVRHHPEVLASGVARSGPPLSVEESRHVECEFDSPATTATGPAWLRREGEEEEEEEEEEGASRKLATEKGSAASVELQLSTQISSKGIGIGYSAAVFAQCIAIGIVIAGRNNPVLAQRFALLMIGAWWAVFTIPAALFLRPRPGPPLTAVGPSSGTNGGRVRAWFAYTTHAWRLLFRTVKMARRLTDMVLFLAGWFLLSDATSTLSSTAILFAKNELHMKPWSLAMINVISTVGGIGGAFGWPYISRKFGLKPHQTILAVIGLFVLVPLYGLLGYLPVVQSSGVLGLQQAWEMYPLGALYGFVLGGISSYCRSLFGELIPPGSEAAFYALYAITDKGSSVFGPTIVGLIIQKAGAIRPAFWFVLVMVAVPAPLIYMIDMERGRREAENLAATEAMRKSGGRGRVANNWSSDGEDDEEARAMITEGSDRRED